MRIKFCSPQVSAAVTSEVPRGRVTGYSAITSAFRAQWSNSIRFFDLLTVTVRTIASHAVHACLVCTSTPQRALAGSSVDGPDTQTRDVRSLELGLLVPWVKTRP